MTSAPVRLVILGDLFCLIDISVVINRFPFAALKVYPVANSLYFAAAWVQRVNLKSLTVLTILLSLVLIYYTL